MKALKLQMSDIVDLREYERQRDEFRKSIIELKRLRRISLGEIITIVFENRETIRFQIQEMARAEKMLLDDQIATELEIYNPLIPDVGELKATLFLELTSKELLQQWLPNLVGIERSIFIKIGDGPDSRILFSNADKDHESQLTREDVTASVHYVEWQFDAQLRERFSVEKVFLGVDHPNYKFQVELSDDCKSSLKSDWSS